MGPTDTRIDLLRANNRPPLWLASTLVATFWGTLYDLGRTTTLFILNPFHIDFRVFYVAGQAGLERGWTAVYDLQALRSLSSGFPATERFIDPSTAYVSPPVLAWIVAPLTALPLPAAYVLWTAISLAALVGAWYLAAPYGGLAKLSLLLLALSLWPVMDCLYLGQPSLDVLALTALAWWLCARDRTIAAGLALALAMAMKPHIVILVPVALLVSGRYRVFAAWAAGMAVLAAASVVAIGPSGMASWWRAVVYLQSDVGHYFFTMAQFFGRGPVTYGAEALLAVLALVVAWRRRSELEMVFAAGLLGSIASAFHIHQDDFSLLILAAWLVLRTAPPLWHRWWLLSGVVTMQLVTLSVPVPQLIWDVVWLAILALSSPSAQASPVAIGGQAFGSPTLTAEKRPGV